MLQRYQFGLKDMNPTFRRLAAGMIVLVFAVSRTAFAEPESISWRDLVPPLDESLLLDGDFAFGEQVRFGLITRRYAFPVSLCQDLTTHRL